MHAAVAALARKHGWSASEVSDVESLLAGTLPDEEPPLPPGVQLPWRPEPATVRPPREVPDRYEVLGELGRGGMGVVQRVRDRWLNRVVARKQMHLSIFGVAWTRFLEEAQATAQLQHPGIVPVYDVGESTDGRLWFTMKEVRGETFRAVIRAEHRAAAADPGDATVALRRLVTVFSSVCRAVGFAHERGVVHRDLKPTNVMVAPHGEVLVMDWGIAKVLSAIEPIAEPREAVQTTRDGADLTRVGAVMGTPWFMPPEQARGEVEAVGARSDVYALGAMLYELLSGDWPYRRVNPPDVLAAVIEGPPPSLRGPAGERGRAAFGVDLTELVEVCERAMSRAPESRYADGTSLAAAVQGWLDGSRRREQALAVVAASSAKRPEAAALRERASALRAASASALAGIPPWGAEEEKASAWALADEAAELEERAERAELAEEQLLQGSLTHAPDLAEAHAALAERYRAAHAAAEAARESAAKPEALLRQHLNALPEVHPVRRSGFTYLQGDGALTLVTDPPGAEVALFRYLTRNRRLVAVPERSLGRTPLRAVPLPRGSWLCEIRHPARAPVRYPVFVGRGEHWDGVPPEGGEPSPVRLPLPGALGPDDCFVPGGWFWSGGDLRASHALARRRLWVDDQVFRRFPVTNREYLAFLDGLVAAGREEEALRHAPREQSGSSDALGAMIYGRDGRRFTLRPDADGDLWSLDWPVLYVDWFGASAFAAWEAARTGQPWRLPGEIAWEKAARGVDGRIYPWGDHFDSSWACTNQSHPGRPLPAVVDSFPVDESVYGIRGMAGNVRDVTADIWHQDGPPVEGGRPRDAVEPGGAGTYRVFRGGSFGVEPSNARSAYRGRCLAPARWSYVGFRLARPAP